MIYLAVLQNVYFRNTVTINAVPGETIIGDLGLLDDSSELLAFSFGGIFSFGFGILVLLRSTEFFLASSGAGVGDFGDLLRLRVEPRARNENTAAEIILKCDFMNICITLNCNVLGQLKQQIEKRRGQHRTP